MGSKKEVVDSDEFADSLIVSIHSFTQYDYTSDCKERIANDAGIKRSGSFYFNGLELTWEEDFEGKNPYYDVYLNREDSKDLPMFLGIFDSLAHVEALVLLFQSTIDNEE